MAATLIRIARQIRPDETVTLQQTMIAIQSLNPEAFADGNINRLLIGQVLRIPTKGEISAFDAESAFAEVSRQNQAMVGVVPNLAPGRGVQEAIVPRGVLALSLPTLMSLILPLRPHCQRCRKTQSSTAKSLYLKMNCLSVEKRLIERVFPAKVYSFGLRIWTLKSKRRKS